LGVIEHGQPAARGFARSLPALTVRAVLKGVVSVSLTLLGLCALTFVIGRVLPLDPVIAIVGDQADQATYDMVYKRLGLDRPIWVQFLIFLGQMLTGDFGSAIGTGNPIVEDIARVFPATVELSTVALIVGAGMGLPLGVAAAVHRGSRVDHVVRVVSLIGHSVPIFWLGLMGLVVFYAQLGWVGGSGRLDTFHLGIVEGPTGMLLLDAALAGNWEIFASACRHIVLPGFILGYSSTAFIARMTRSFMLEQLSQEYVIAARAKGMSKARVIWLHAFPNIGVQLVTILALAYGGLLEGAVLTETVFAWPGFGSYFTAALLIGDMNAVVACTFLVGIIFIGLNLISDILYRVLDPRTK
jgi:peptide/nickel transport system permease protein